MHGLPTRQPQFTIASSPKILNVPIIKISQKPKLFASPLCLSSFKSMITDCPPLVVDIDLQSTRQRTRVTISVESNVTLYSTWECTLRICCMRTFLCISRMQTITVIKIMQAHKIYLVLYGFRTTELIRNVGAKNLADALPQPPQNSLSWLYRVPPHNTAR